MKKIFSMLAVAAVLTACVKDLNTLPLNPTDTTSETAYGSDESSYLSGLSRIFVSAGRVGCQVELAPADLVRVAELVPADLV